MTETREVRLPAGLCDTAEKKFAATFGTLEELIVVLLWEVSRDEAEQFDEREQRLVEERLKELGYL